MVEIAAKSFCVLLSRLFIPILCVDINLELTFFEANVTFKSDCITLMRLKYNE